MSQETNLVAAWKALQYTRSVMVWGGAPNKDEDKKASQDVPRDWVDFKPPDVTTIALGTIRRDEGKLWSDVPGMARVMIMAESAEKSMLGNCAEQSSIACKFLSHDPSVQMFCLVGLGKKHECVIVGVEPRQISGTYPLDAPPAWPPEAVICDPWYGFAYAVRTGWTTHVPMTLQKADPTFQETHVQVSARIAQVWNSNPLHKKM